MPQTYTETVPARDVRRGDVDPITGVTVASVRVGTKWVTITNVEPGHPWKVAADEPVEVQRQRPTDEEQRALRLRAALEGLDWTERQDRERLARASAGCIADLTNGRMPNWSDLETVATDAERVRLWDYVARRHLVSVLDVCDHVDGRWSVAGKSAPSPSYLADAAPSRLNTLGLVARETLDDMLMRARLGDSTSPASRLAEDGAQAGRAAWLRDTGSLAGIAQ